MVGENERKGYPLPNRPTAASPTPQHLLATTPDQ